MPKFMIERTIPGAGKLTPGELMGVSRTSCAAIQSIGPQIQWVQSFVTDDKIYCMYIAPDEATIRRHGELGGFPVDSVTAIRSVIDPTTAD